MKLLGSTFCQSLWLALASIWLATPILFGLVTVVRSGFAQHLSDSGVVVTALSVALVSSALRLPTLTGTAQRHGWHFSGVVWWLCCLSTINWLGFIGVRANHLFEFGLTLIVLILMEGYLHFRAVQTARHPWRELHPIFSTRSLNCVPETEPLSRQPALDTPRDIGDREQLDEDVSLIRQSVEGIDLDGQRYLSGWVKFQLAHQQKNESIAIAFCPAIVGEIDVELECQPETVVAKSTHTTAAGMRIEMRRTDGSEPISGKLYWHVTQAVDATRIRLPSPKAGMLP